MSKVLVIDDHPMVAETLTSALIQRSVDATSIDPTVVNPVDHLREHPAAFCVMDLYWGTGPFPGVSAISGVTDAGATCLVLTGTVHEPLFGYCLELGAVGVVTKQQPFDQLVASVIETLDGGCPNSDAERLQWIMAAQRARREHRRRFAPFEALTASERAVLADLVQGHAAAEIADQRCVALSTVRTQVHQILAKLDVRSQVGAVALATEVGWRQYIHEAATTEAPDLPAMLPR